MAVDHLALALEYRGDPGSNCWFAAPFRAYRDRGAGRRFDLALGRDYKAPGNALAPDLVLKALLRKNFVAVRFLLI